MQARLQVQSWIYQKDREYHQARHLHRWTQTLHRLILLLLCRHSILRWFHEETVLRIRAYSRENFLSSPDRQLLHAVHELQHRKAEVIHRRCPYDKDAYRDLLPNMPLSSVQCCKKGMNPLSLRNVCLV